MTALTEAIGGGSIEWALEHDYVCVCVTTAVSPTSYWAPQDDHSAGAGCGFPLVNIPVLLIQFSDLFRM